MESPTRRRLLQAVAVGSTSALAGCDHNDPPASSGTWPMFQFDAANAADRQNDSGPVESVTEKWTFQVPTGPDDTTNAIFSSPVVANGLVYVGSNNGTLYALNANDGTVSWSFETNGKVESTPVVSDETLYVGCFEEAEESMFALDATTGDLKWSSKEVGQVLASLTIVNDMLYVGDSSDTFYALDAESGGIEWEAEYHSIKAPAVDSLLVFIVNEQSEVVALNAVNGAVEWSTQLGDPATGPLRTAPTVANDTVYVGGRDGFVYALEKTTGNKKWEYDSKNAHDHEEMDGGPIEGSVAATSEKIFAGTLAGNVHAIDVGSGLPLDVFTYSENAVKGSPVVVGGTVYFGSIDHSVYAFDAVNVSNEYWEYQTSHEIEGAPAVTDDTLYVASQDTGTVYALEPES